MNNYYGLFSCDILGNLILSHSCTLICMFQWIIFVRWYSWIYLNYFSFHFLIPFLMKRLIIIWNYSSNQLPSRDLKFEGILHLLQSASKWIKLFCIIIKKVGQIIFPFIITYYYPTWRNKSSSKVVTLLKWRQFRREKLPLFMGQDWIN